MNLSMELKQLQWVLRPFWQQRGFLPLISSLYCVIWMRLTWHKRNKDLEESLKAVENGSRFSIESSSVSHVSSRVAPAEFWTRIKLISVQVRRRFICKAIIESDQIESNLIYSEFKPTRNLIGSRWRCNAFGHTLDLACWLHRKYRREKNFPNRLFSKISLRR